MLLAVLLLQTGRADAGEPVAAPGVSYLKGGAVEIRGSVLPMTGEGIVCYACGLVRIRVDGKEIPFEIRPGRENAAEVVGKVSGLGDGPHTATEEILDGHGKVIESRRVLFFTDTHAPVLDVEAPAGNGISPDQTSFVLRFSDEGSGIPAGIQSMRVSADVNGGEAHLNVSEKEGARFLLVDAVKPGWHPGQDVRLSVRMEDRAGNAAELTRRFSVENIEQETKTESVTCSYPDRNGKTRTVTRTLPVMRRFPFPVRTSVKSIVFDKENRSRDVEIRFSSLIDGYPIDPGIPASLRLISTHPGIKVIRDPVPPGAARAKYTIIQKEAAGGRDHLASLVLRHPRMVEVAYDIGCRDGMSVSTLKGMVPSGGMAGYAVPVSLYWSSSYSDSLTVDGDHLKYRFSFDTSGGLDAAASWFEMDGKKCWLKETGRGAYEAGVPAREGYRGYRVTLTLSRGRWDDVREGRVTHDGAFLEKSGEVFVKLAAPVIENFSYDRDAERFRAVVRDEGTAVSDLVLKLSVAGSGEITAVPDPDTGAVEADFPAPAGITEATLLVTDLAGQSTRAVCRIFGRPPAGDRITGTGSAYPASLKVSTRQTERRPACPGPHVYRRYFDEFRGGRQRVRECDSTFVMDRPHPFVSCIRAALAAGKSGAEALSQCERIGRRKNTAASENLTCRDRWVDTLSPRIRDISYDPSERVFLARIDDHGAPLPELRIDFLVHTGSWSSPSRSIRPPYVFDPKTGVFRGQTGLPPEYELFDARITVTDGAGNNTRARLDVSAPRSPPEVALKILKQRSGFSASGENLRTSLMADCRDISGINHDLTRIFVDGCPIQPAAILRGEAAFPDRVLFTAALEEGEHAARVRVTDNAGLASVETLRFTVSSPPEIRDFKAMPSSLQLAGGPAFTGGIVDWGKDLRKEGIVFRIDGKPVDGDRIFYDPDSGYFAVDGPFDFSQGSHLARVTVTDNHGNRAERSLVFIPGERMILSPSGDGEVRVEDIVLWEMEDHNGDGRANPGELVRLFVTLGNSGGVPLNGVVGELVSEEDLIRVEKERVDYGRIDPSCAPAAIRGFDVRIGDGILDATARNPYDASFHLEVTAAGGRSWFLPITLPVYRPTIPVSAASPVSAAGPSVVTVAVNGLPPTTDQAEMEITGTAASSASVVDHVTVLVNGEPRDAAWDAADGRFSVTVPLRNHDNTIEVRATDRSGAMGFATAFINRFIEPPEVTITNPIDGGVDQFFSYPYLEGKISTGGSKLASVEGHVTAPDGSMFPFLVGVCDGADSCWYAFQRTCVGCEGTRGIYSPDYLPCPYGDIELTVTVTTIDGDTVTDVIHYHVTP